MFIFLEIGSELSTLIPLAIALFGFQRRPVELRILAGYFLVTALLSGIMRYLASQGDWTFWLMHIYTPLEYGFFAVIFSFWERNLAVRRIIRLSVPLFVAFCLIIKLFAEGQNEFDNFSASIESVLLVALSLRAFVDLNASNPESIFALPRFWISAAVLLYFAGSLIIFSQGTLESSLWSIHNVLNISSNLLFAVAFLCHLSRPKFFGRP